MKTPHPVLVQITHFIHHNLIWVIISSYLIATLFPSFGLSIRSTELNLGFLFAAQLNASLPLLMLAMLLFNAALGVNTKQLQHIIHQPRFLITALIGNWAIPLVFILIIGFLMQLWHDTEETQQILMGLALIVAMPIAGASTAWSQNANGNLALSLGLVLFTTLLSPLFTPLIFHIVGWITTGDYSEDLHELASGHIVFFLGIWVVFPSLLGIATRYILDEQWFNDIKHYLKPINYIILILLNYSNAALTLPKALSSPDIDLLFIIMFISILLCATTFYSGYCLAKHYHANRKDTVSLMFGLGMNNNGTALVLASITLVDHPEIMIPIIIYNLVQHLAASIIDSKLFHQFL